jgi:hypothetical protein
VAQPRMFQPQEGLTKCEACGNSMQQVMPVGVKFISSLFEHARHNFMR